MSITLKIAAVAGAGTLGVAGWMATRPEPTEPAAAVSTESPEPKSDVAVATPQAHWEARRSRIERALGGEAPAEEEAPPAPPVVEDPPSYEELAQGCLEDLGAKKFGTITYIAREIGAPDIGTIYESIQVAHSSFEDPEVRECLVESMHSFVGPAPEEAFERTSSKALKIGKPATPEEMYEQIVSRIISAHINEVRYCGTVAGDDVQGHVRLKMDFDGGDVLAAATPEATELPSEVVDCIQKAALRWKFPKSPSEHVIHHTFNVPIPIIPPGTGH